MLARILAAAVAFAALASCSTTGERGGAVERMYVIDCGENHVKDIARWSPGVNAGKPMLFGNHCYLIRHAKGWMLWDTGMSDLVATMPKGLSVLGGLITYVKKKTLIDSLKEIGVTPADIGYLAFSHLHGDHCGNGNYFTAATLYMQAIEYANAFGPEPQKSAFNPAYYGKLKDNPVVKLNGDHDVFGDGSVVIKSTPGHTAGHQSLFVRLAKSAPVVLSGDMVHFSDNWNAKRVPALNVNQAQSLESMKAIEAFLAQTGARLWISHDKEQHANIPKSPKWVE